MTSSATAGSFHSIAEKRYDHGIKEMPQELQFQEGPDTLNFTAKEISSKGMQFTVAHNNSTSRDELYRTTVQGGLKNGGKIVQIYEKNTGRYFYLVSLGLYIDGVHYAAVVAKVMGIDPHDGTWRTYDDAKNYYHPSNYFGALLRVTAAGDTLRWRFRQGSVYPAGLNQLMCYATNFQHGRLKEMMRRRMLTGISEQKMHVLRWHRFTLKFDARNENDSLIIIMSIH